TESTNSPAPNPHLIHFFITSLTPSETQSRKTSASKEICKNRCTCEERENILNINCENKGFTTFVNYGNVTSLHLGNNGLQEIKTGAFNGLRFLKRLHLNNNNLEVIKEDTFAGLESLEYLQADYNYISAIEPGAFSKLNKLKVLILNDNLLLSLPPNIFHILPQTFNALHNLQLLFLNNNLLRSLPDNLSAFIQIDLQENPWDCTCDIVALKNWMELSSTSVVVNEITCDSPSKHAGRLLRSLRNEAICPEPSEVPTPQHAPPTKAPTLLSPGTEASTPTSPSSVSPSSFIFYLLLVFTSLVKMLPSASLFQIDHILFTGFKFFLAPLQHPRISAKFR
uniref:SLIT and NTRK-like family, member 2 n=1 Tax=Labrus bergylta TaxID=56723 RepID=A0A3Q3N3E7_9LABR